MPGFVPVRAAQQLWEENLLGAEVYRLHTRGAVLTVVKGQAGDVVPRHGYSQGAVTYVVSGRVEIDGEVYGPGDAGTFEPGAGFYAVRFLEDSVYVVARDAEDRITLPDLGEDAVANLDA